MQRYFLNEDNQFYSSDIHHILNVMRFKTGTNVEVCGQDGCSLVELIIDQKSVTYNVLSKLDTNPPHRVTIIQGLPKGDKIDFITKSATLFQAKNIYFMPMKRSIAKLSNIEHKITRLEKIAKEAAELSKRSRLPQIDFIYELEQLDLSDALILLLDEQETKTTLKSVIFDAKLKHVVAIIGPEGGIDDKERSAFIKLGAIPVTLGKTILPTEFAHIPLLNAFL